MSIEMHVFFRGKLPDKRALSRAMAELGFPLTIAVGSLERQSGFMPMRLRREETGVEFDVFNERAAVEELAGGDIDPRFERSANFRWGGSKDEMLCGMCAAAVLARLVNGIVLDGEAGKLLSADEAIAQATQALQTTLKPEDTQQCGTRPADIKRYLKPLLKQRSDLVLIGRALLIRPVRHVLRGAFLDRTSDKYCFRIWAYLDPLWSSRPTSLGYLNSVHDLMWKVWQPHFEPMLMDALQQDIFEPLGEITTLDDVAAVLVDARGPHSDRVALLTLAGERERAEKYVRDIEVRAGLDNSRVKSWVEAQRRFLARDVGDVCAEAHAGEAKMVKALKLESIWEPSPFSVEVPAAERKRRTAEPAFVAEPWIPRPPGLLQDVPEQPGDIRFAKDWLLRDGHVIMVAALSREQAEERSRNVEGYVLAARLPDGLLLLLNWHGKDRLDPDRVTFRTYPVILELRGLHVIGRGYFEYDRDVAGVLKLESMRVRRHGVDWAEWEWSADWDEALQRTWDRRGSGQSYVKEPLSGPEHGRLTVPWPGLGEFEALVQIVRATLRSAGYGEIT
jgi:hypothetical protein